jgi:hypothetical protein
MERISVAKLRELHESDLLDLIEVEEMGAILAVLDAANHGRLAWEQKLAAMAPDADPWSENHATKESRELVSALDRFEFD